MLNISVEQLYGNIFYKRFNTNSKTHRQLEL